MESSTLVKFGKKEHIESLFNKGELYMNNLPYFWKVEGDTVRHDPNDSLYEYQIGTKGKVTYKNDDGKEVVIDLTNWELRTPPTRKTIV